MTEKKVPAGFVDGDPLLDEILAEPGMADAVDNIDHGVADMNRIYAQGLAEIRKFAAQTQSELAERMGIGQAAVSRIEGRDDLLLSTLAEYAAAAGAVNGDFNGDVVALRKSDGAVLLYRGSGPGTLNDYVVAISGQTDLRRIMGVGDLNGDRKNDLLAEDNGGKLWLYAGDGTKGFSSIRQPVTAPEGAANVLG